MGEDENKCPAWIAEFIRQAVEYGDLRLDYMPLFISDFFADDNVEVMNTEQRGAYLMLLMRGWHQSPPASVPPDDDRLSKWAGQSLKSWQKMREKVMRPFSIGADGRFYQKRLCREWLNTARRMRRLQEKVAMRNANANRRRAREKSLPNTLTKQEWLEIIEYFCGCCAYCLMPTDHPTIDHLFPLSKGGGTTRDNTVPACLRCNSRKNDKNVLQFMTKLNRSRRPRRRG